MSHATHPAARHPTLRARARMIAREIDTAFSVLARVQYDRPWTRAD